MTGGSERKYVFVPENVVQIAREISLSLVRSAERKQKQIKMLIRKGVDCFELDSMELRRVPIFCFDQESPVITRKVERSASF